MVVLVAVVGGAVVGGAVVGGRVVGGAVVGGAVVGRSAVVGGAVVGRSAVVGGSVVDVVDDVVVVVVSVLFWRTRANATSAISTTRRPITAHAQPGTPPEPVGGVPCGPCWPC